MYRIITSLVAFFALLIVFSAFSSAENLSITDFTMHKVKPTQDPYAPESEKKPVVQKPQAVVTKQIQEKIVKQPTKPAIKHVSVPVKTAKIPNTTHTNYVKTEKITVITPQKTYQKDVEAIDSPVDQPQHTLQQPTEHENVATHSEQAEPQQTEQYNSQDIVNGVNKRIEQEALTPNLREIEQKAATKQFNSFDYYVRPLLSLGIVLILIFIFAWVYNKLRALNPNAIFSGKFNEMDINKFTVLASSTLGQGKIIHLVEINGKQLVVGSTNNNISLLTEIDPEDLLKLQEKATKNTSKKPIDEPEETQEPDEFDHVEPDSYSARYSNVYKDYIE